MPTSPITSSASAETTTTTIVQLDKWVKNLPGVPLTEAQFFPAGPWTQFCYCSHKPPYGEYVTTVEQACLNLESHNAEELREKIRGALRHVHNPRMNTTKEEAQALAELRKDHSRVILTANKGVTLVVMDRPEHNSKAQKLLEDGRTYKKIKTDPTNKLKNKLINLLKRIKAEGGITGQLYKKMYPTGAVAPKFYGLPQIHKRDIPPDLLCLVGVPSIVKWLKSYQEP